MTDRKDMTKKGIDRSIDRFGEIPQGEKVYLYTLTNLNGFKVRAMNYGATITSVEVPDRYGDFKNVTLYLDSFTDYLRGHPFFGSIVGRYADQIAGAKFTLDGEDYCLTANNGRNHLHGGVKGFDKVVWKAETMEDSNSLSLVLVYESPDGEEGYPGNLSVRVKYILNDSNELVLEYTAKTDKPTHINLTNHAYWNLGGAGSGDVLGHLLMINADLYLRADEELLPVGEPASVLGTPFDFTQPRSIGSCIKDLEGIGFDHYYVLNKRQDELSLAAQVFEPNSGRVMDIYTTQPGIQLYTANHLDGTLGARGRTYEKHHGVCLETQHYPDSPNHPEYLSTVLRPGETYHQKTIHRFSLDE